MTTGPAATAAVPARPAAPRAQAGAPAVEKIAGESPMDYAKRVCARVVCLDGAQFNDPNCSGTGNGGPLGRVGVL